MWLILKAEYRGSKLGRTHLPSPKCLLDYFNGLELAQGRFWEFTTLEVYFSGNARITFVYDTMFKNLRICFTLANFECSIFRVLNVTPSQLHSNTRAFVKGFVILCCTVGLYPSVKWFHFKKAKRHPNIGEKTSKAASTTLDQKHIKPHMKTEG